MEKHKEYKYYRELYFVKDFYNFKKYKNDKILSYHEKQLLKVRALNQEKEWLISKNILLKMKPSEKYLKGQKFTMLAFTVSFLSEWQMFLTYSLEALSYYEEEDEEELFLTYYNISVGFQKLGLFVAAREYLEKCKDVKLELNLRQVNMLNRLDTFLFFSQGKEEEVSALILKLEEVTLDEVKAYEYQQNYILLADIYFRRGEIEKSEACLNTIIGKRSGIDRDRVLFEYHMLLYFILKRKNSRVPSTVKKVSEFNLRWKVLENLSKGEVELALVDWSILVKKFPGIYGQNFTAKNESERYELFFQVVEKIKNTKRNEKVREIGSAKNKKDKLILLLKNSNFPLSKEVLIEKIWETSYDPRYDSRFYKLVQRTQDVCEVVIENKSGAYRLVG